MANDKSKDVNKNIHDGHRERLRQRYLLDTEFSAFQDHEVLEYLLSFVIPRKDTNPIAHELIRTFKSLDAVFRADITELKSVKGVTNSAAYMINSMLSMMRRALKPTAVKGKIKLSRPDDVVQYMHRFFLGRKEENFCYTLLDLNYNVICDHFKSGYAFEVSIDAGEIMLRASKEGASYVIIAHNHPTGDIQPSFDDLDMTRRLSDALDGIQVTLLDHVIFHDYDFFSMHKCGLLSALSNARNEKSKKSLAEDPEERSRLLSKFNEYKLDFDKITIETLAVRPIKEKE